MMPYDMHIKGCHRVFQRSQLTLSKSGVSALYFHMSSKGHMSSTADMSHLCFDDLLNRIPAEDITMFCFLLKLTAR